MLKLVGPADPLRMVLVRDMWLTGFDAPSLHTMYDALGVNDSAVQVGSVTARRRSGWTFERNQSPPEALVRRESAGAD